MTVSTAHSSYRASYYAKSAAKSDESYRSRVRESAAAKRVQRQQKAAEKSSTEYLERRAAQRSDGKVGTSLDVKA